MEGGIQVAGARNQLRPLEALAALTQHPLTPAELARALGTNRSTALRLVRELVSAGWVFQDESRRYAAGGPKLWGLLRASPDEASVRLIAQEVLLSVRNEFGEAVAYAVPIGKSMVYALFAASVHDIGIHERIGTIRPMHCSALGKAYLSGLPPEVAESEIRGLPFEGGTDRAPRNPSELRDAVDVARARGYALDMSETLINAHCVAVALTFVGTVWGSVGVQGTADQLAEGRLHEIGQRLAFLVRTGIAPQPRPTDADGSDLGTAHPIDLERAGASAAPPQKQRAPRKQRSVPGTLIR